MRFITTIILRLYVDPDVPDLLCGNMQLPSSQDIFSFKNEADLIALLHQLGVLTAKKISSNSRRSYDENNSID
jgi:hypothetical protein